MRGNILLASSLALLGCAAPDDALRSARADVAELLEPITKAEEVAKPVPSLRTEAALVESLRAAVQAEPRIMAARADVQAARARFDAAGAEFGPQMSASGQVGGLRALDAGSGTQAGLATTVEAEQVLLDGGARKAALAGAAATLLAAEAHQEMVENTVALEALTALVDLWHAEAQLTLLRSGRAALQPLRDQTARSGASGLLDRSVLAAVERDLLALDADILRAEATLKTAQATCARFFDLSHAVEFPDRLPLIAMPAVDAPAGAEQATPALRVASAEVLMARAAEAAARAALSPQVGLRLSGTSPLDTSDSPEVALGLQLHYVLGDGGRRKAQRAAAEVERAAAEARLSAVQSETIAQISAAHAVRTASQALLALRQQASESLAEELVVARTQLSIGERGLDSVIALEMASGKARAALIDAQATAYLDDMRLAASLGLLAPSLMLRGVADGPESSR